MATHSSILVWDIPWTEEPGGLQSMGSHVESDTTYQLNDNVIIHTGPCKNHLFVKALFLLAVLSKCNFFKIQN